jgi:hypothetical protein
MEMAGLAMFSFAHVTALVLVFLTNSNSVTAGQVRAVGKVVGQWSKGHLFEPELDSDHILSPITINWFTGVSIMWPAAPYMLRCLWA